MYKFLVGVLDFECSKFIKKFVQDSPFIPKLVVLESFLKML